jgi:WD40 repeat protein
MLIMDVDRALAIIKTVLAPKSLTSVQIQIIQGVIAGQSYQEIAAIERPDRANHRAGGYKLAYIKETGSQLWQTLSQRLGHKVTKKSLVAVLVWYEKQLDRISDPDRAAKLTDWGEGLQRPGVEIDEFSDRFYGREAELATLTDWCVRDRCRTISLVGMGGMGKSTLAWELAHRLAGEFDRTIWRSLLNVPPVKDLCADLLRFLSPQSMLDLPETLEGQIELLIASLNRERCLLVLDNVESILAERVQTGRYLSDCEDYDRLFKSIGELAHQSCLLLTSCEKPHTIVRLEITNSQLVRSIDIGGLTSDVAHELVRSCGCPQIPPQMWQEVYTHYSGNPLALKIAALAAVEMTGGGEAVLGLYPLMTGGKLPFRNIDDILHRQFERLSAVEQQLVYWLAIEREAVTSSELRANLIPDPTLQGEILSALQSILRQYIAIRQGQSWKLPPVTIAYVTQRSISAFVAALTLDPTEIDRDNLPRQFAHLNTYAIVRAQARDYLRQVQIQSILRPIVDRLLTIFPNRAGLTRHLQQILNCWQLLDPIPPGYLAGNILNLLAELAPNRSITDVDCSGLPIWSAYLADVRLHRANFAAATFDRTVFTQAFGGIVFATFNPAGDLVATGDANGDIYLWRIADGERVAIYHGHSNWTRSLAFSPDGAILASASDDCTVKFWEIATGRQIGSIGPHTHSFRGIKFNNDGRRLVTGGDDGKIRIYDLAALLAARANPDIDTHCLHSLVGHTNWVFSATYSPDERQLASTSADGTVRIWDLATGDCLHVLNHPHWTIRAIFSPDGRKLIVSGMSADIYIWDPVSGKLIQTLTGHADWVWSIACSPDGKTLYSAGEDRTIRSWDLGEGTCVSAFRAHNERIWTLSVSPDGERLVSGSEDRTIKIWDLDRGKCIKTIAGYGNWIKSIAFIPDRDWLASGHHDRTIRIWDLSQLACIHTLDGHTDAVVSIAVSPDGHYLASSSLDRTIRIWDLRQLTCSQTIEPQIDSQVQGSWSLTFSPDSRKLIAGGYNTELSIWDIATGKLDRAIASQTDRIQSVTVCKVHARIATTCENTIKIWDLHTGACLQTISAHYLPVLSVAFSPDGSYLASGSMDKTAKIWETNTWQCVQTLIGHQSWVITVAFSPVPVPHLVALATGGNRQDYRLIGGGCDRTIKSWDISTGKCLQTYLGHTNWVWSIAYSPDGQTIVSAGEDETINIWDVAIDRPLHTLRLKRPYEDTQIAGATGLLPGQIQTLKLLGAIVE